MPLQQHCLAPVLAANLPNGPMPYQEVSSVVGLAFTMLVHGLFEPCTSTELLLVEGWNGVLHGQAS